MLTPTPVVFRLLNYNSRIEYHVRLPVIAQRSVDERDVAQRNNGGGGAVVLLRPDVYVNVVNVALRGGVRPLENVPLAYDTTSQKSQQHVSIN